MRAGQLDLHEVRVGMEDLEVAREEAVLLGTAGNVVRIVDEQERRGDVFGVEEEKRRRLVNSLQPAVQPAFHEHAEVRGQLRAVRDEAGEVLRRKAAAREARPVQGEHHREVGPGGLPGDVERTARAQMRSLGVEVGRRVGGVLDELGEVRAGIEAVGGRGDGESGRREVFREEDVLAGAVFQSAAVEPEKGPARGAVRQVEIEKHPRLGAVGEVWKGFHVVVYYFIPVVRANQATSLQSSTSPFLIDKRGVATYHLSVMKTSLLLVSATLALSSALALADGDVIASVTLRDASVIKGTVAPNTVLEGAVAFKNDVKLPAATIREMAADGTNAARIVTLANGDKFHFTPTTTALSVESVLGKLEIALSDIKRASFSAVDQAASGNLIFHCTFDSPEAVLKPAIGPAGTLGNATMTEGKFGMAMHVPRYGSAGLFRFPKSFLKSQGCIEFWARIDISKAYFSDCDPRLFAIRTPQGYLLFLEYSSNNGRG